MPIIKSIKPRKVPATITRTESEDSDSLPPSGLTVITEHHTVATGLNSEHNSHAQLTTEHHSGLPAAPHQDAGAVLQAMPAFGATIIKKPTQWAVHELGISGNPPMPSWQFVGNTVMNIEQAPFAEGGMRCAFMACEENPSSFIFPSTRLVAKRMKPSIVNDHIVKYKSYRVAEERLIEKVTFMSGLRAISIVHNLHLTK